MPPVLFRNPGCANQSSSPFGPATKPSRDMAFDTMTLRINRGSPGRRYSLGHGLEKPSNRGLRAPCIASHEFEPELPCPDPGRGSFELFLETTVLSRGKRTTVPERVKELLKLRFTPGKLTKLLWTQEGEEMVVTRGTPQSSFMKTLLSSDGTSAVPKHVSEALKLKWTPDKVDGISWIQKGNKIIVRKGTP